MKREKINNLRSNLNGRRKIIPQQDEHTLVICTCSCQCSRMSGIDADAEIPLVCTLLQSAFDHYNIKDKMDQVKAFGCEHPFVTLFLLVTIAMCSVPVFCFIAFVLGSAVLAFAGFVFFEGAVLTLASVLLGGVLTVVGVLAAGFSCFFLVAFYAYRLCQRAICNMTGDTCSSEVITKGD
ncbi:hypothetical protein ScPMuIL_003696 [Solemya velum]